MLYFITGGERSGKSRYAQELALSLSTNPVYVATARKWDESFEQRIKRHQQERGPEWQNMEEEKHLSKLDLSQKVVVIDCVTLWLTNFYTDNQYDLHLSLQEAKEELTQLFKKNNTQLIIISNEIGMGVHAQTESARRFVELQGWTNQYIARQADQVTLMVSGIPLKVK
ncbi:bifunctional adenosylcobinamide kinase/adenosylcobinamide-phosphate guanylyltransferase [Xanthocytophaga agilis]|uniref:Adenosylcobinamide kinase n=1 Tax=Xanthocytophaga agilis TaxID=3048010 RepID=A0AAE3R2X5_9BACT|nr:bifunctional adenosylcobinamide kinase/adenosylcobinamide-phosphate guanylyltransferase [Xanthocytophaga agilis]MDJ1499883.1 bifunctional adenosylcobinamide kinase/adenosylcobinamide-phosphate guanylyltransferase [Xanthocytophaga agilis]